MGFKNWAIAPAVVLATGLMGLGLEAAYAADRVILRYGASDLAISIEELQTFATTGGTLEPLERFLEQVPISTTVIRRSLTAQIALNPDLVNRWLDTTAGRLILSELDKTIGAPTSEFPLWAMRFALRTAYADDNKISLLELIDNYPEAEVVVNLDRIEQVTATIQSDLAQIEPALAIAWDFLGDLVCTTGRNDLTNDPDTLERLQAASNLGQEILGLEPTDLPQSCATATEDSTAAEDSTASAAPDLPLDQFLEAIAELSTLLNDLRQ